MIARRGGLQAARPVRRRARIEESQDEVDPRRRAGQARALGIVVALAAVGLLPALLGIDDVLAALAWMAVIAPASGVIAAGAGVGLWPFGIAVPAAWMVGVAWLDAAGDATLPEPVWAALAWTGLYALGSTLGALAPRRAARNGALALLVTALLAALPVMGGAGLLGGRTVGELSPAGAARLFDLSPVTVVIETGGVDWMRHAVVYDAAGTEWFSDRRAPYRGRLAGPLLLVVGCASALVAGRRTPRAPE
jgi:hypothetical protein